MLFMFVISFTQTHYFFQYFHLNPSAPPQTMLETKPKGSFHYSHCRQHNKARAALPYRSLLALFFSYNMHTCLAYSSACRLLQATASLLSIALPHFCNDICRRYTL